MPYDTGASRRTDRAVVLGAGLAGLVAARVLSDHYDEVLLLERDSLPGTAEPRRHVPQAHHAHGLLDSGRRVLVRLFPGLGAELDAAGALTPASGGSDPAFGDRPVLVVRGGRTIRLPAWWAGGFGASRVLIEHTVRARVRALPGVTVREGTTVTGLQVTGQMTARAVTGVLTGDGPIGADLVVDAGGRASRLPEWLAGNGFEVPKRSVVHTDVRYASVQLEPDPSFDPEWLYVLAGAAAHGAYVGGVVIPIEGGRLQVSLGTIGSAPPPPTDWARFVDYARANVAPVVTEALESSTPVTGIRTYRVRDNEFRHYQRIHRPAGGVVAIGDAAVTFNPIYGQGMSVASMSAAALGAVLEQDGGAPAPGFERRVARAVARTASPAWQLALSEDLRYGSPATGVPGQFLLRSGRWYRDRMERAAALDPEVALAFSELLHLYRTPAVFATPRMLRRVLRPLRDRHPLPLSELVELLPRAAATPA